VPISSFTLVPESDGLGDYEGDLEIANHYSTAAALPQGNMAATVRLEYL